MLIYIKLTFIGASAGTLFDLFSDADPPGVSFSITDYPTGVPIATLYTGVYFDVNILTTSVRIVARDSQCEPTTILIATTTSTSTSTSSTTTTSTTCLGCTTTTTTTVESFYKVHACEEPNYDYTLDTTHVKVVGNVVQFVIPDDGYATVHCGTITDVNYTGPKTAEWFSAVTRFCGDDIHCEIASDWTTTTTTTGPS